MKIHVIEDDPVLARGLQINLELEKYTVILSSSLSAGTLAQSATNFDFIILDLGLPDGTGFSFLMDVRVSNPGIPIIILSAQSDEDSVVKGLQLGANDFIKKPYSFKELHARMKLILKKPIFIDQQPNFAGLKVFSEQRVIKFADKNLDLKRREFDILAHLIQRAEMLVSRETLISIFNKDSDIFDRTIDSHISHIRKCLKESDIHSVKISSVYGLGYRLEKNE